MPSFFNAPPKGGPAGGPPGLSGTAPGLQNQVGGVNDQQMAALAKLLQARGNLGALSAQLRRRLFGQVGTQTGATSEPQWKQTIGFGIEE